MSLSSRRAWIEIPHLMLSKMLHCVALLTESVDWNSRSLLVSILVECRSPHGERGLKFLASNPLNTMEIVALLTESVDWNAVYIDFNISFILSLSSRRAWIEIKLCLLQLFYSRVALLTESVDWNLGGYKNYFLFLSVALLTESVDWNNFVFSSQLY